MSALGATFPLLGLSGGIRVAPHTVDTVLTDEIGASYGLSVIRAQPVTASDVIHAHGALTVYYGAVVTEHVLLSLAQTPTFKYHLTAADTAFIHAVLNPAVPALLAEHVGVALAQQAQQAISVIEGLGLHPLLAPMMLYGRTITDTIRVASVLGRFFGGDLTDGIHIASLMGGVAAKGGILAETIGVSASLTPRLILRVTATDTINIEDVDALRMLFDASLDEGIEIAAGYVAPNGSFTTWAVNTRSGAVTEYSNYAFNSFAKLGDVYLGASSTGLYELVGDDDAGTDIVAQIKSGFAQWAGTKLTGFKGAYLGVRGGGDYVLKLETGDGNTYIYAVSAKDMATTKITLGKGLRARYFAFELISTGQDFDLDTIEFVPLIAERRV
jgi:hypothetical protein